VKIRHITNKFPGGGSARIAWDLHRGSLQEGHDSRILISHSRDEEDFRQIPSGYWYEGVEEKFGKPLASGLKAITGGVGLRSFASFRKFDNAVQKGLGAPLTTWRQISGLESMHSKGIWKWLEEHPDRPDLFHGHTLEGEFFDLSVLRELGAHSRVVLTLHNAWFLTGLCHHFLDCPRWKTGCGNCPQIGEFPEVRFDFSRANWKRKQKIYRQAALNVAAPCRWLLDQVSDSILEPAVRHRRVIPNGVDTSLYCPGSRQEARGKLGLESDAFVITFVGNKTVDNKWKVFDWMADAVRLLRKKFPEKKIRFMVVGQEVKGTGADEGVVFVPPDHSPGGIAPCYQAADVYLHAARMDTFPTTVLEAMACGLPVVATRVGGIPEQVQDGVSGWLVDVGDPPALAERLGRLLESPEQARQMGQRSLRRARECFSIEAMRAGYRDFYQEVLLG
jgi:glycosyltransferase involved in cell wall biosynthesis